MFPRRGAIALVTTAIALVLLFNFKTPDPLTASNGVASTGGSTSTAGGSSSSTGSSTSPATGSNGTSSATGTETVTGSVIATRYGNIEVQVTISNGSIASVDALKLPSGGRSGAISQYVEPILSSEALTAQSANIEVVSGATYTSEAYAESLQSALDQAAVSSQAAG